MTLRMNQLKMLGISDSLLQLKVNILRQLNSISYDLHSSETENDLI